MLGRNICGEISLPTCFHLNLNGFFSKSQPLPKMAASDDFKFQLSSSAQLDKIDKLRDLGVGDFVALPQLVVVGDQSSGKSSVLEAILELPFPRDSGLCTRFATHVSMRRIARKNIRVTIVAAASSSPERRRKLDDFKKDGLTSLTGNEFTEIFQEVCIFTKCLICHTH
jgi:Dynamin family